VGELHRQPDFSERDKAGCPAIGLGEVRGGSGDDKCKKKRRGSQSVHTPLRAQVYGVLEDYKAKSGRKSGDAICF
jgi:hypothetical protein